MAKINETAYSYYLTTYANIKPTQYDTHNKNDLRKVYNRMVKTNKESPLYKLLNEETAALYAIDIKENAKNIQHVVASLSDNYGTFNDSFHKKVAISDNTEKIEAAYVGDGTEDLNPDSFLIEVQRLSSPQVNVGNYLKNDDLSIQPGSYSFDLNTTGSSYEFQFNVTLSDTNLDILKKLANLINHSTSGVTGTIRNGNLHTSEEGTSALVLTSNQTGLAEGEPYLFHITTENASKSAKIMKILGIDKVSSAAQNSLFTLNGKELSSLSNTFTVNNTFELTLKETTEEGFPVDIGFKTDNDAIADNIMSLVEAFNNILKIAEDKGNSEIREGHKLYNEISRVSKTRKESLGSIGLIVADDGSISLDKEQLANAVSPERAEETFDLLSGFKNVVGAKADKVAINPMNYIHKLLVAYKNPQKNFAAPYYSSVYSGMIMDRYI